MHEWQMLAYQYAEMTGKLVLAGFLGFVVGWEREKRDKAAGLRTFGLICMGSCLFTLIGVELAHEYAGDPMRMIQGMMAGIGFLAGGVIFHQGTGVKGITTAAGLWLQTAVGLAVGLGYYFMALVGTLLCFVVIAWVHSPVKHNHHLAQEVLDQLSDS